MNNLKRVLSLALASVMLIGMMAVGASAASADFSDKAEIEHEEAVSTMVALNIITGYPDGTYLPDNKVTRAEMAKMIYVALNGGRDNPNLTKKDTPTYTDIKGNWAEGYIEYVSALGIIAGYGDGTFNPKGNVTGQQAAKMLLVALGYNAKVENLEGTSDWGVNADRLAFGKGFYDGVSIVTTEELNRDDAAQIIYNAINTNEVDYEYTLQMVDGTLTSVPIVKDKTFGAGAASGPKTLLEDKYNAVTKYAYLQDATYDADKKIYTYTFDNTSGATPGYATSGIAAADRLPATVKNTTTDDVSTLFLQKVKVTYSATTDTILGITAADSKVLGSALVGDLPSTLAAADTSVKADGTTYNLESTKTAGAIPVYEYLSGAYTVATTAQNLDDLIGATIPDEWTIDFIDNNGNDRVDVVVIHPVDVVKVVYVGTDSITVTPAITTDGATVKKAEANVYEGIAKGDWVVATRKANTVDNKTVLEKAEVVTGTVAATRNTTDFQVDGTWYSKAVNTVTGSETMALKDDVTLVLVNGYYAYADVADAATSKDLLVVTKIASSEDINGNLDAKVLLADGTAATVKVAKLDGNKTDLTTSPATGAYANLYTYSVSNDVYTLTPATTANTGYDAAVAANSNFKVATSTVAAHLEDTSDPAVKMNIADDAVVFIRYSTDTANTTDVQKTVTTGLGNLTKTTVVTGKELKTWNAISGTAITEFGATANTKGFIEKSSGNIEYAKVLFLAADTKTLPNEKADDAYGYIVSAPYKEQSGSKYYIVFDLWNGTETVTVKDEVASSVNAGTSPYVKGTVVTYQAAGEGVVDKVTADFTKVAILGYNAEDKLINYISGDAAASTGKGLDKDIEYLWIDTKNVAGVKSEGVELATEASTAGTYYKNAFVKVSGSNVVAIVMDVNNILYAANGSAEAALDNRVTLTMATTTTDYAAAGKLVYASTTNWSYEVTLPETAEVSISSGTATIKLKADDTVTAKGTSLKTASNTVQTGFEVKVNSASTTPAAKVADLTGTNYWGSDVSGKETATTSFKVTVAMAGKAITIAENT